jgi:hypothetical protein
MIDGDTIEARVKAKKRDVRLIGLDTTEVFGGEECGSAEASESMRRMLFRGTRASLIRDRNGCRGRRWVINHRLPHTGAISSFAFVSLTRARSCLSIVTAPSFRSTASLSALPSDNNRLAGFTLND